ncbi:MAG: class I SAM-dependent methyltransferase [Deltaproteobacteria bacterium]|nr:class I SAM-dependent methyltransferase [Deltaproteobacteria bacterium]
MESYQDVLEYFAGKASRYDEVDQQVYWQLSDRLLWWLLEENVLSKLSDDFRFLDAGGGTGRWSKMLFDQYSKSTGSIVDLSEAMLGEARRKFSSPEYQNRVSIRCGNIEGLSEIPSMSFDLTFNFHNVLGFVKDPQRALSELSRVTRSGGAVVSVIPNINHVVFFNLFLNRLEEAERTVQSGKGRFTQDMPDMHVFSLAKIEQLYKEAGLSCALYGFPVSIYPGFQETQLSGSSKALETVLGNADRLARVLEIEKVMCLEPGVAARGNNLMAIGWKA